jgi:flagellar hook-associated protein 3 FlgL
MGVSTIGSQLNNLFLLQSLRQQLNNTQMQISTGKKGNMLSDLGGAGASSALSYRNSQSMLDGYMANLNVVKGRVSVMDKALANVADTARDTLTTLRTQLQSGQPFDAIMRDDANNALQNVMNKMNIKLDGRYLFSGSDVENPPHNNATALTSSVAGTITTLMGGGSFDKNDVLGDMRGITGNALGFSTSSLVSESISFRADDGRDIDYTVHAHQEGFNDILRGLATVANLPTPTNDLEKEQYWTLVNSAIDLLDQGAKAVDTYQGNLGSRSRIITDLLADHEDNSLTLKNFIGSIEDIDMADAATRLQQLQAQLQISYNVTASLKDLSLVNFL